MLQAGIKAPDFTLPDRDGKAVSLSDFRGKKTVVYFYPKDDTPGCTRQACAFAGTYAAFQEQNVAVIGISKDSIASHQKFAEKYHLPFILLADPELKAIQAYDVWHEKMLYGKKAWASCARPISSMKTASLSTLCLTQNRIPTPRKFSNICT